MELFLGRTIKTYNDEGVWGSLMVRMKPVMWP